MSSYLQYRFIDDPRKTFKTGINPTRYTPTKPFYSVKDSNDLQNSIVDYIGPLYQNHEDTALMLSGGMDSAILAALVPKGTKCFTFRSNIPGTTDESPLAAEYAKQNNLEHEIIDIDWQDFIKFAPELMIRKGAPIHSISVQIYVAAKRAREQGYLNLLFGEMADIVYGGHTSLLGRDWTEEEFVDRYSYVDPTKVLKSAIKITYPVSKHLQNDGNINTHEFLKDLGLRESADSYVIACDVAGVKFTSPFGVSRMVDKLDLLRVRNGENKYIIRELFADLYENQSPRKKLPMPRAVDQYLAKWNGPTRPEFVENLDMSEFSGDQKWYIYCLEWFLNILEGDKNGQHI